MTKRQISMFFILGMLIILACVFFNGCSSNPKSQVQLSSISGSTLNELPEGINRPHSLDTKSLNIQLLSTNSQRMNSTLLYSENTDNEESFNENTASNEDGQISTQTTISSIPQQTVVIFDSDQYASITIKLDNPYEYYVCDFYMICSEPNAMIWVDDEWLPLDGSAKIRWTGATNRKTTYTVFLPDVSDGATITIQDMRYLNEKEIAVDLAEHDIAKIYRIESPVRTQFVVNTPEFFLFKVIQSENCVSVNVDNATYDPNEDAYKMTENAAYKVKFTYKIPGTELLGEGEIVSEEIKLLTVYIQPSVDGIPFFVEDSEDLWNTYYGTTCHIGGINFIGTGITFHIADLNDEKEKNFPSRYFCDTMLTVSIGDSEFAETLYLETNTNGSDRFGWLYLKLGSLPTNLVQTFTVKWNGYIIYTGNWIFW